MSTHWYVNTVSIRELKEKSMTSHNLKRSSKCCGLAILVLLLASGSAQAEGDVTKGEQVFKKCMACHAVNDKTNKVGPHLVGIVGRPVARLRVQVFESMTALPLKCVWTGGAECHLEVQGPSQNRKWLLPAEKRDERATSSPSSDQE